MYRIYVPHRVTQGKPQEIKAAFLRATEICHVWAQSIDRGLPLISIRLTELPTYGN